MTCSKKVVWNYELNMTMKKKKQGVINGLEATQTVKLKCKKRIPGN